MLSKIAAAAVTAALAAAPTFVAPTAGGPPPNNPPVGQIGHWQQIYYNRYIQLVDVRTNILNPDYITKCGVDSPGQTCTISETDTRTSEVNAQYGASESGLSATIGVSASRSVAIQTGCQSPKMNPGEEYVAFPTETRYYYQVYEDRGAFITDYGEYMWEDDWQASPVAYTAVFEKGFRCRVRPQVS